MTKPPELAPEFSDNSHEEMVAVVAGLRVQLVALQIELDDERSRHGDTYGDLHAATERAEKAEREVERWIGNHDAVVWSRDTIRAERDAAVGPICTYAHCAQDGSWHATHCPAFKEGTP